MLIALALVFLIVSLVAVWLWVSVWNSGRAAEITKAPPRIPASQNLTAAYREALCRAPDESEILEWDTRPFETPQLVTTLRSGPEGQKVSEVRRIYSEALLRTLSDADCIAVRDIADSATGVDDITRRVAASDQAQRVAGVRRIFVEMFGRDPSGSDRSSLRRWVDSGLTLAEIGARLAAQRPLVGVHYFTWYSRSGPNTWGNGRTSVYSQSPKPALGWYNSNDPEVMDAHIAEMTRAGFDFVILNVVAESPPSWQNAHRFFDRLAGRTLRAAVMLDGLNVEPAAAKATWVQKARSEFAAHASYFSLRDEPLIVLFAAPVDFAVPGVALRNVYWTPAYAPGANTFNPQFVLYPHDWPFWEPSPQSVVNGVVSVAPGYDDTHLGRTAPMLHPRNDGRMYHDQWQRALALHPELIVVYSWNEHFEQTAIEPTGTWGDRYLQWTACYTALAHMGKVAAC